jgi:hypothetical protein
MQYVLLLVALFFAFATPHLETAEASSVLRKPVACHFFTYTNAEKILGKKVSAEDGGMTNNESGRFWKCVFSAAITDGKSSKVPKLYFVLIQSPSEDAAKRAFGEIRRSNKTHAGFAEWPGIADEAVVHSDGPNFHFIMVRKGAKTFRVKVNPANGVSLDEMKTVAVSLSMKL